MRSQTALTLTFKQSLWGPLGLIGITSLLSIRRLGPSMWFSNPGLPAPLWQLIIGLSALAIATALWTHDQGLARRLAWPAVPLGVQSLFDSARYYQALAQAQIHSDTPLPMSLLLTLFLSFVLVLIYGPPCRFKGHLWPEQATPKPWYQAPLAFVLGGIWALIAVTLVIVTFGATRYQHKADCAVILGAGVYDDGRPSLALTDRIDEGIRLYKGKRVRALVMSGGRGRNGFHESEVMRRYAMEHGVPSSAIVIDWHGKSTAASARSCRELMKDKGYKSTIVVSHYYHLLRSKAAFRSFGIACVTSPAPMTRRLQKEPYFVFRECVALLYYTVPGLKLR